MGGAEVQVMDAGLAIVGWSSIGQGCRLEVMVDFKLAILWSIRALEDRSMML